MDTARFLKDRPEWRRPGTHAQKRGCQPRWNAPVAVTDLLSARPALGAADDELVVEAEAEEVRRALERLPEDQRRALLLAAVAGRSAAEVGEIEGIPLGTAKTRIRAALTRMRDSLEVEARRGL